jgi:hypothetical protein
MYVCNVCMYVRVCVDLGHQVSWRSLTTVYVVWFEELIFFGSSEPVAPRIYLFIY